MNNDRFERWANHQHKTRDSQEGIHKTRAGVEHVPRTDQLSDFIALCNVNRKQRTQKNANEKKET